MQKVPFLRFFAQSRFWPLKFGQKLKKSKRFHQDSNLHLNKDLIESLVSYPLDHEALRMLETQFIIFISQKYIILSEIVSAIPMLKLHCVRCSEKT